MTKTSTILISHRRANPGLLVLMQMVTMVDKISVLNFEFGSLGFVCDLSFGA